MKGANAGLKLFLASQLLGDVATTAFRYRNPLAQALMDTTEELEQFRKDWKAIAEKSIKQTQVNGHLPELWIYRLWKVENFNGEIKDGIYYSH